MPGVRLVIVLTGADCSGYHYPTIVPKSRQYQADGGASTEDSDPLQHDDSEMDSGRRSSHLKQNQWSESEMTGSEIMDDRWSGLGSSVEYS